MIGRYVLVYAPEYFDNVFHALEFAEVGCVYDDALAIGGNGLFEMVFVDFAEALEVHKIVDNLDVTADFEFGQGFVPKEVRDRRHPVRSVISVTRTHQL